jgi:predicted metal-dependent hydrolase
MNRTISRPAPPLTAGGRAFPVDVARHPRARRYVLRVTHEGRLRLTVPRGASIAGGMAFAERQQEWITREWRRLEQQAAEWGSGTRLWYRGERVALCVDHGAAAFADRIVPIDDSARGVRRVIERHLRQVAACELPPRTARLAAERGIPITVVKVRDQRSRWGSCSTRGTIALNWRLIQMPIEVADYVILHELAHRRHPNHSARFWREVEAICPWWQAGERWLRKYGKELL